MGLVATEVDTKVELILPLNLALANMATCKTE